MSSDSQLKTVPIIYDHAVDEEAELLEMARDPSAWCQKVVNSIKSQLGESSKLARFIVPKRLGQADLAVATSNVKGVREIFPEPPFQNFDKKNPTVQFFMRHFPVKQAKILAIGDVRANYIIAGFSQPHALDEDILEWLKLQKKAREDLTEKLGDLLSAP